jgi:hypothetical protein
MNANKQGLVATVFPRYFEHVSKSFGLFTNYYTFMQGFDEKFAAGLGVQTLRPEDLGWTDLATTDEWFRAVSAHFNPNVIPAQQGSPADRECIQSNYIINPIYSSTIEHYKSMGLNYTAPYVNAICVPKIKGATDYHFAVNNGMYWLEQAGKEGSLNIWTNVEDMLNDVYSRHNNEKPYYVRNSHFFFKKRIE